MSRDERHNSMSASPPIVGADLFEDVVAIIEMHEDELRAREGRYSEAERENEQLRNEIDSLLSKIDALIGEIKSIARAQNIDSIKLQQTYQSVEFVTAATYLSVRSRLTASDAPIDDDISLAAAPNKKYLRNYLKRVLDLYVECDILQWADMDKLQNLQAVIWQTMACQSRENIIRNDDYK